MAFDLLDRPEIGMVLFHPRPEYAHLPEGPEAYSVRFAMADRTVIGGRLHPAGETVPVVLFFHGNGEIASDYDDLAPLYRRLGLTLLVADYRGYGISGGHPTATALAGDALEVFDQTPAVLAAAGLKPAKLLVMGRSMGSAAALVVAEARGGALAALIIESGFADTLPLVERLGGRLPAGASEERDGFGSLARIARVTVPTLVIHGEEDWIIPFSDGRRLYEASGAAEKRLLRIEGAGHNDLMMVGVRPYFQAIGDLAGR
ncbi:MAG: alpha/beta fold hydrolase [Rhodospirillaceae bacterium]